MIEDGELSPTGDSPVTLPSIVHEVQVDEAFLTRITLVEDQPLAGRAAALGQIVDELRAHLEATDGDARLPGA
jgi:hypothetical protein